MKLIRYEIKFGFFKGFLLGVRHYHFYDEKIYEGKYNNSSNQIALIDGDSLTEEETFTLMFLLAQRNNLI